MSSMKIEELLQKSILFSLMCFSCLVVRHRRKPGTPGTHGAIGADGLTVGDENCPDKEKKKQKEKRGTDDVPLAFGSPLHV